MSEFRSNRSIFIHRCWLLSTAEQVEVTGLLRAVVVHNGDSRLLLTSGQNSFSLFETGGPGHQGLGSAVIDEQKFKCHIVPVCGEIATGSLELRS